MNKREAFRYLSECVSEAILEAEVPLHYLVGGANENKPCRHQAANLREALLAVGYSEAADAVARLARLDG